MFVFYVALLGRAEEVKVVGAIPLFGQACFLLRPLLWQDTHSGGAHYYEVLL